MKRLYNALDPQEVLLYRIMRRLSFAAGYATLASLFTPKEKQ